MLSHSVVYVYFISNKYRFQETCYFFIGNKCEGKREDPKLSELLQLSLCKIRDKRGLIIFQSKNYKFPLFSFVKSIKFLVKHRYIKEISNWEKSFLLYFSSTKIWPKNHTDLKEVVEGCKKKHIL